MIRVPWCKLINKYIKEKNRLGVVYVKNRTKDDILFLSVYIFGMYTKNNAIVVKLFVDIFLNIELLKFRQ